MTPLDLYPDPQDRRVWENFRRIADWTRENAASLSAEGVTFYPPPRSEDHWLNFRRLLDWSARYLPGLQLEADADTWINLRKVTAWANG